MISALNVRANKEAREAADRAGIEIRQYNIIYDLVDDVKAAMGGLLAPINRETMLGNALIKEIFAVSKVGKVAGCLVTDGIVERGQHVRLIRDNVVIHEGKLATLNRYKDAVNVVQSGQECGMSFENYQDMRAGDVIECYHVEVVQRTLLPLPQGTTAGRFAARPPEKYRGRRTVRIRRLRSTPSRFPASPVPALRNGGRQYDQTTLGHRPEPAPAARRRAGAPCPVRHSVARRPA